MPSEMWQVVGSLSSTCTFLWHQCWPPSLCESPKRCLTLLSVCPSACLLVVTLDERTVGTNHSRDIKVISSYPDTLSASAGIHEDRQLWAPEPPGGWSAALWAQGLLLQLPLTARQSPLTWWHRPTPGHDAHGFCGPGARTGSQGLAGRDEASAKTRWRAGVLCTFPLLWGRARAGLPT